MKIKIKKLRLYIDCAKDMIDEGSRLSDDGNTIRIGNGPHVRRFGCSLSIGWEKKS